MDHSHLKTFSHKQQLLICYIQHRATTHIQMLLYCIIFMSFTHLGHLIERDIGMLTYSNTEAEILLQLRCLFLLTNSSCLICSLQFFIPQTFQVQKCECPGYLFVCGDLLLWHRPSFHRSASPPPKPTYQKKNCNQTNWFNLFSRSWLCSHMTGKPLTKAHDPGTTFKASLELFCYVSEGLKPRRCISNKKKCFSLLEEWAATS